MSSKTVTTMMQTQLVVSLFGKLDVVQMADLFEIVQQQQCRALDSHVLTFGSRLDMGLRISGNWDRVTRVESALREFAQKHQVDVNIYHEQTPEGREAVLPYVLDAIGLESADIAAALLRFCVRQSVSVRELSTRAYRPARSVERLIQFRAEVDIPTSCHLGQFKTDFFDLCDALNLDAAIEPNRTY
jgi:glycine cleavage system transcriptional repressor